MTFVPTPQPAAQQQQLAGAPSQSGGPAAGAAQHHMMMTQPAAPQQHSLHTAPQMIMQSQPQQPGMQAPPVGAHQYVQTHAIPSNYSSLLCDVISVFSFCFYSFRNCVASFTLEQLTAFLNFVHNSLLLNFVTKLLILDRKCFV